MTWCYLCAAPAWSERLPASIGSRLRDAKDALFGPAFPHIGTMDLALAPPQVNLLHELCAWVVAHHAATFRAALLPLAGAAAAAEAAAAAARLAPRPRAEEAEEERALSVLAGARGGGSGRAVAAKAAAAAAALAAAAVRAGKAEAAAAARAESEDGGAAEGEAPLATAAPNRLSAAVSALLGTLPSG